MKSIEKLVTEFENSKYSDISIRVLKYILIAVSILFLYNLVTMGLPTGVLER